MESPRGKTEITTTESKKQEISLEMSEVFKAYDIRGIYPTELNEEMAFKIGWATVKFLKASSLVVGRDARLSSPSLAKKLIEGVNSSGCNVIDIGMTTTPLLYFSVNYLGADGGAVVTASHNPAEYNGFKIVGSKSKPVAANSGLLEIKRLTRMDSFGRFDSGGVVENANFLNEYLNQVISRSGILKSNLQNIKIVADASNGVIPLVLKPLFEILKIDYTPLYFDVDGRFPNHLSDISREENLKDLQKQVVNEKADLGVAFDGDGDRIMFIDEKGKTIKADSTLAMLYKYGYNFWSRPRTVYDLRSSRSVKELLEKNGIASRPGHTFMKSKMIEVNGDLGAELSGHLFFKEMNYVESAALAMLKVLKVLVKKRKPASELIRPFLKYFNSGEVNIEMKDREQAARSIKNLKEKHKDGQTNDIDGILVDYKDWWFSLRVSNTESLVRLVVEANTKELMEQKVRDITIEIKNAV